MSSPGDLSQTLQEVSAAFHGGDYARAMLLSEQATDAGLEHPSLLTLAAHKNLQAGIATKAERLALRAVELAPASADARNVLGIALLELKRPREAIAAFEAGLRDSPGLTALYYGKAQAHDQLNELDHVRGELETLITIQPDHPDALAWLADLASQRDDLFAARSYADRALALASGHHGARITLAVVDVAEKKYDQAEKRLQQLLADDSLTPINRAFAESVLGDALDGMDRTAEAFARYAAAKGILRRYYAPAVADGSSADRLARLTGYFRNADPAPWRARKSGAIDKKSPTHVFLVGFPRSGTTLLEQVLAGHPDIETMEERDAFTQVILDFMRGYEGLDRLAALPDAGLDWYRAAYWAHAAEFGHKAEKPVFVDKMPLNTVLMPVIARLFPDAKLVFALRDPRDVVLSCFRRRFRMSPQMYELTTLESAAAYYDAVMSLAEIYRAKLDLDLVEARHEDLLTDFEAETRRLCGFLGLTWREEMKNFSSRARESTIHTPSGAQIARGLNRAGMAQWRRYEAQMAPVLETLGPWAARYGYEEGA
jgi:tetratricopeptide (TPR) repeat protein